MARSSILSRTASSGGKYTSAQVSKNRRKALLGGAVATIGGAVGVYALNNLGGKSSSNSSGSSSGSGTGGTGIGADDGTGGVGGTGTGGLGDGSHPTSDRIAELLGKSLDENSGYILHLGDVLDTYYYANLEDISFEGDYKEMTDSATVKMGDVDKKRFYKGIRVSLKTNWRTPSVKKFEWKDLSEVLLGFITEQSFHEEETELKLDGKSKTLDKKYKFKFTDMKRSEIIREVILCADLVPVIDVTGLDDDVTSFSNLTESSSGDDSGDVDSTGSATIDEAVKKAIQGKSGCLEKAKAIDKAFKNHIIYDYYYDCDYANDLDKAWKDGTLNCADGANVLSAMFNSAGISATIIHTDGHYIVRVTCEGKDYYTDNAANSGNHTTRPFGEVYGGKSGSEMGKHLDY